jgi:hypothetical protein
VRHWGQHGAAGSVVGRTLPFHHLTGQNGWQNGSTADGPAEFGRLGLKMIINLGFSDRNQS